MDALNEGWWGSGVLKAAHTGDIPMLKRILQAHESDADSSMRCPGVSVRLEGESDEEQRRRRRRVAINYRNEDGFAAVHLAASAGHLPMLRYLAAEGADFDARTAYGRSCLHLALEECFPAVLSTLLSCDADPCVTNSNGHTPLQVAQKDLDSTKAFCTNLQNAISEERQRFSDTLAALQKELGILEAGTTLTEPEEEEGAAVSQAAANFAAEKKRGDEERTRGHVVIEMEDLETEHNELVEPMTAKLGALQARHTAVLRAVELLKNWRGDTPESDMRLAGGLEEAESESEDCAELCPEHQALFDEYAMGDDNITVEEMQRIYSDVVHDDFGVVHKDPLQALHGLLRWIGLDPMDSQGRIFLNEFALIMLKLEQR